MSHIKYHNYDVTSDGRVFSIAYSWRGQKNREMTQHLNYFGYSVVHLSINKIKKKYFVHKLVAEKFLPPKPSPNHMLRHLDGNKQNNNVSNLAWGTMKDNTNDRERHGKTSRGYKHSQAIKRGLKCKKTK